MLAELVLLFSVSLQAAAALLALRLLRLHHRQRWAWGAIVLAIGLMATRRATPLYRLLTGDPSYSVDLSFELVGLAISALMLAGIAGIGTVFRSLATASRSLYVSTERLAHLNAVLRAIRDVNQAIAKERQRPALLSAVASSLVDNRGYKHAWIALMNAERRVVATAQAGMGSRFDELSAELHAGKLSPCLLRALDEPEIAAQADRGRCGACPLCGEHGESVVLASRLEFGGELYGVLAATLFPGVAVDREETALFQEAAGDVAFALRNLRVEEERCATEKRLLLDESRLEALLQLNQMDAADLRGLTDFALEQAVRLTESHIGYLAFTNEDESVLTMHSWSRTAMQQCEIVDKPLVYPVAQTGLWGEAIRQRRPVITNDYRADNPLKKGCPDGHVPIVRHMNVPVFDAGRIVIVAGVGNKPGDYDESDVRQLTLLMQGMWQLLRQRSAQEALRNAHDELEQRVRLRTAELAAANDDLEQERYLLRALMDNVPYNIYFKDAESRFIRINRAMARQCGLATAAAAVGRTDREFFLGEHADEARADEARIIASGQPLLDKEEKETWRDGRVGWVATTKMPLYDDAGRIVGTFGISRDVTEQKHAAEALRAAKEAAEAANRAKSSFLANMSHEIRTPLNAILGMTELVFDTPLSAEQRDYLSAVRDSGDSLLSIVDDILDFSKIEAGKLRMEEAPFDLRQHAAETLKSFSARAARQGLELAMDIAPDVPQWVTGDYPRLRQVLVNLLGNALKFTERGRVHLSIRLEAAGGSDVALLFTVADTGIGIPREKQAAIFEMFEQVDNSLTRRHGGTGLGLAIASHLVDLMGGRIWVESEPGVGSRFHFTVRVRPAGTAAPAVAPMATAAAAVVVRPLRILLVEDSLLNQKLAAGLLTKHGHAVTVANNGRQAIELLPTEPFDVVLMDVQMPVMDGLEATATIRRNEAGGRRIPIVAMTAHALPEDRQRCLDAGMDDYIAKPIRAPELLRKLAAATQPPEAALPEPALLEPAAAAAPVSAAADPRPIADGQSL